MGDRLEIDIVKIIETKSGKKLPSPVGYLIQRLIHERSINDILHRLGHLEGIEFMEALLQDLDVQVSWANPETLPENGRALFVSNHALGALDGIGLSTLLAQKYGSIRFLVNDLLYNLKPLQSVFLPVNSYGKQSREAVEHLHSTLASEVPVGSFPAGYCSRLDERGVARDRPWQKSFVQMAIQHQRDIIPLYFDARLSWHFYQIDKWRKRLGIGFDVATALLPDEMFRGRGSRWQVLVGAPISWESLRDSQQKAGELADQIQEICYSLPHTSQNKKR